MKVLIQRVSHASVTVDKKVTGQIDKGLLLLVGIDKHDTQDTLKRMAKKVLAYRVFADENDKMNLNVVDVSGGVLAVSQFTLSADTQKGLRPSFSSAAPPQLAHTLFDDFIHCLNAIYTPIETGIFGADMKVSLLNDGPVTFMLEM